ncbi:MAG: TIGR03943 family putative permease subunit [Terrimicrobiaceae bacterium]
MTCKLSRCLNAATLLIWGGTMTYFFFSGRVASYLHPAFHPGTLLSGLVLIALAGGVFFLPDSDSCCREKRPVGGLVLTFLILTIPLIFATGISPGGFGASAVLNRGLVENISGLPAYSPPMEPPLPQADGSVGEGTMMDPSAYLAKNKNGQIKVETVDLLYAAAEPTMREDFENKAVEITGQFLPARTGNPNGDRFNLVRMFVMCCAADARPVAVTVQGKQAFPEMTWLKVTGLVTFPVEAGKRSALILADTIEPTEPPPESFIY